MRKIRIKQYIRSNGIPVRGHTRKLRSHKFRQFKTVVEPTRETQIDPKIRPTVNLINRFPDLVTLYSCQGHRGLNKYGERQIGYLSVAGEEEDILLLLNIAKKQDLYVYKSSLNVYEEKDAEKIGFYKKPMVIVITSVDQNEACGKFQSRVRAMNPDLRAELRKTRKSR